MGYPMRYRRVITRNGLEGGYDRDPRNETAAYTGGPRTLAGDLRRLEEDTCDEYHLAAYARIAGITPEQVMAVFDAFFANGNSLDTV